VLHSAFGLRDARIGMSGQVSARETRRARTLGLAQACGPPGAVVGEKAGLSDLRALSAWRLERGRDRLSRLGRPAGPPRRLRDASHHCTWSPPSNQPKDKFLYGDVTYYLRANIASCA
jgi:hypothetical protein